MACMTLLNWVQYMSECTSADSYLIGDMVNRPDMKLNQSLIRNRSRDIAVIV